LKEWQAHLEMPEKHFKMNASLTGKDDLRLFFPFCPIFQRKTPLKKMLGGE
jgi:hypothetical protein